MYNVYSAFDSMDSMEDCAIITAYTTTTQCLFTLVNSRCSARKESET